MRHHCGSVDGNDKTIVYNSPENELLVIEIWVIYIIMLTLLTICMQNLLPIAFMAVVFMAVIIVFLVKRKAFDSIPEKRVETMVEGAKIGWWNWNINKEE